jgi:hypothetical protein
MLTVNASSDRPWPDQRLAGGELDPASAPPAAGAGAGGLRATTTLKSGSAAPPITRSVLAITKWSASRWVIVTVADPLLPSGIVASDFTIQPFSPAPHSPSLKPPSESNVQDRSSPSTASQPIRWTLLAARLPPTATLNSPSRKLPSSLQR